MENAAGMAAGSMGAYAASGSPPACRARNVPLMLARYGQSSALVRPDWSQITLIVTLVSSKPEKSSAESVWWSSVTKNARLPAASTPSTAGVALSSMTACASAAVSKSLAAL